MTQQPKIRVAILGGAGAMGAVFGARLFQAGHDVTLIDVAKAAVDTINAEGLRIASSSGESQVFQVPATV
ncbi:MAG TPA: 2-dehydropantoate 2-reductase N-terminal domain-containing protein, partial [Polyangiaceae bacterium]